MNLFFTCAMVFLAWLAIPSHAHAYLDPGTTGYVLQLIIGAAVGALYAIKMYWYRIKAFVNRALGKTKPEPVEEEPGEPRSAQQTEEHRQDSENV